MRGFALMMLGAACYSFGTLYGPCHEGGISLFAVGLAVTLHGVRRSLRRRAYRCNP